jgi:hypothetical protein
VYQSCPEEIFQFVDDDVVDRSIVAGGNAVDTIATVAKLSNYQKTKLATFLNSGDAEPTKQRYYPVTPVIQGVIDKF